MRRGGLAAAPFLYVTQAVGKPASWLARPKALEVARNNGTSGLLCKFAAKGAVTEVARNFDLSLALSLRPISKRR